MLDTEDFLKEYGFGKYKCTDCGKEVYLDENGKKLILAEMTLSEDKTEIIEILNVSTAELLIIPESAIKVTNVKFSYQKNLKYVLFANTEYNYWNYINLQGCQFNIIRIPDKCSVLLYDASINFLIWDDGVNKVDKYNIYSGCRGRECGSAKITNLVIPVSLSYINENVFSNATVKNIFIKV